MVFSGGGTGGHLYPALALADALAAERRDVRPRFVGAQRGLEARVLPERGHEPLLLDVEGLARSRPLHNVTVLRKLVAAVRAT
ncbi:MAG: glycosyltransferase, partial [Gemmatimonadetes bacterium]|nr:glycosyltransferase [Gemmatimonadota bacterium]